ncbi:MAG: hypothetical protein JRJ29_00400 [Deltaproteobacteria bacterium]|nr:hypothetical protein [Deltaproteobacteria bacterium]MBW2081627.1 hypothetical protein [Deltaproteobacteria bacterium]
MIRFELPIKLKTTNELKRMLCNPKPKVGAAMYAAYRKKLTEMIEKQVGEHCNLGKPRVPRRVRITYFTKRLQDEGNFRGLCLKPLEDALVDLQLIRDDSPEWVKIMAEQIRNSRRAYRVVVEII